MAGPVMHIAGAYVDQRQFCRRCDRELLDNRNVQVEPGSGPPGRFAEGAKLRQSGGCTSLMEDSDDSVPPCRPVN